MEFLFALPLNIIQYIDKIFSKHDVKNAKIDLHL